MADQVIFVGDKDMFIAWMREAVGCNAAIPEPPAMQIMDTEEVNTYNAKRILQQRGYRVTSNHSFQATLKQYGIGGEERGKCKWYKLEDINKIPRKN